MILVFALPLLEFIIGAEIFTQYILNVAPAFIKVILVLRFSLCVELRNKLLLLGLRSSASRSSPFGRILGF